MKKIFLLLIPVLALMGCNNGSADHHKPTGTNTFLPAYNAGFYTDVLSAATGVGMPFLLGQKYFSCDSVRVKDSTTLIVGRDSVPYNIYEHYVNPNDTGITIYFIKDSAYSAFGITALAPIWPSVAPNAFYNSKTNTFNATFDCVGFGTRVLSAVGDTSVANNPYRNLQTMIRGDSTIGFANTGYVAKAYQFAVSFPLVNNAATGWQYISGGIAADSIRHYDTAKHMVRHYKGQNRGNFKSALPGDILSFGYAPSSKDNGHFMVIAKAPQQLDSISLTTYLRKDSTSPDTIGKLIHTYRIYAVAVFDCSGVQSHFDDSRTTMSGIGHGTLILLTNPKTDVPEGFIFGPNNAGNAAEIKQGMVGQHVFAISVGRWVPLSTAGK